jgi:hypothetical protein
MMESCSAVKWCCVSSLRKIGAQKYRLQLSQGGSGMMGGPGMMGF